MKPTEPLPQATGPLTAAAVDSFTDFAEMKGMTSDDDAQMA
jgi:hypothetical protein